MAVMGGWFRFSQRSRNCVRYAHQSTNRALWLRYRMLRLSCDFSRKLSVSRCSSCNHCDPLSTADPLISPPTISYWLPGSSPLGTSGLCVDDGLHNFPLLIQFLMKLSPFLPVLLFSSMAAFAGDFAGTAGLQL